MPTKVFVDDVDTRLLVLVLKRVQGRRSVNQLCIAMNAALGEQLLYPNRLHALLSGTPHASVHLRTVNLVVEALTKMVTDTEAEGDIV